MNLIHAVWEPAGAGPHPTVIALHGYGASALDLLGLAPGLGGGRLLVLAPQGPTEVPFGPPGSGAGNGWGWFPLSMGGPPDALAVVRAVRSAREFIDAACARYPVDRRRIVLLGFSQGGVVAHALALGATQDFRGLAALSSWLPEEIARMAPPADRRGLAALIQHGTRDDLIPVARGRESQGRLVALGVNVEAYEYDMGHEISPESAHDLSAWLERTLDLPPAR